MPLLRHAPFRRRKVPKNINLNSPLYYIELTGEVFTKYEEFCYRIIQCNSLVWTCAETGKTDLTFSEALESERNAKQVLACFPEELKVPALYLASIAQCSDFQELISEVYNFMEDHYFINELVVPTTKCKWKLGKVLGVKNPQAARLQITKKSMKRLQHYSPPSRYEYEISANVDGKVIEITSTGSNLRRPEDSCLTKDTLSAFLKQNAVLDARGIWVIKGSVLQLYNIQYIKFDDIFCGDPPVFSGSSKTMSSKHVRGASDQRKINRGSSENVVKQSGQQNIEKYLISKRPAPVQSNQDGFESDEDIMEFYNNEIVLSSGEEENEEDEEFENIPEEDIENELVDNNYQNTIEEEVDLVEKGNCSSEDEIKVVWDSTVKPNKQAMRNIYNEMEDDYVDLGECPIAIKQQQRLPSEHPCLEKNETDKSPEMETSKKVSLADDFETAQKEAIRPHKKFKQTRMFGNPSSSATVENKKPSLATSYKKGQNTGNRGRRKQKIVATLKPWVQKTQRDKDLSEEESPLLKATSSTTQTLKEKKKNWLEVQREIELREKERKQEEKQRKKAKLEEEKLKFANFMKEWRKHREDLLCEDLKPLPVPTEINYNIPNALFGDFMMILEFYQSFGTVLKMKIPGGLTFEFLERALLQTEMAGPLIDIIKVLLTAIFDLQVIEYEKPKAAAPNTVDLPSDDKEDILPPEANPSSQTIIPTGWCEVIQGVALHDIPITPNSVSEVLRRHLLISGGRVLDSTSKWLNQASTKNFEDPGLWFRKDKPSVLTKLSVNHICDLSVAEKLEILCCLVNQLLTFATVRDIVDERCEQVRQARANVRSLQVAEIKLQKEATAKRVQEKKDARLLLSKGSPQISYNHTMHEKNKIEKEITKLKVDIQKKTIKVLPLAMSGQLLPLGCDRAHRKYWLFSSLPGLFVEYNPFEIGPCLPQPTPRPLELSDTLTHVRRLFEEESLNSDKENDSSDRDVSKPPTSSGKKTFGEQNNSNNSVGALNDNRPSEKEECNEENVNEGELLLCTASNSCPVHCSPISTSRWYFFSKRDDITALLESLNDRGIRESALLRTLKQEEQRIVECVSQCPVHKLNPEKFAECEQRKSTRQQAGNMTDSVKSKFPPDTPVNYIMERTLRECILDLENRITIGGIGSLKVNDRTKWRKALENESYDKQCEKLEWGIGMEYQETKGSGQQAGESKKSDCELSDLQSSDESVVIVYNGPKTTQYCSKNVIKEERIDGIEEKDQQKSLQDYKTPERIDQDPQSDCDRGDGSSSSKDNKNKTPVKDDPSGRISTLAKVSPFYKSIVKDLASAILQVGQSLDPRCLKKPLADESGKMRLCMKYWELTLMNTINFSQLFIHHSILENSINWVSSLYNSPCFVCDKRNYGKKMIFCNGCNKRYHFFCVKPKLKCLPEGHWECHYCASEESEMSDPSQDVFVVLTRSTTAERKRKAESDNLKDENTDSNDSEESNSETNIKIRKTSDYDTCRKCSQAGELIYCMTCSAGYHLECTNSSRMRRLQRENWLCKSCKIEAQASLSDDEQLSVEDEGMNSSAASNHLVSFNENKTDISYESFYTSQDESVEQHMRKSPDKSVNQTPESQTYLGNEDLTSSPRERRGSASAARAKIASFTKRLRRDSWDDDDAPQTRANETPTSSYHLQDHASRRRSSRRSLIASEYLPLDNAILQDFLAEMLQHEYSWPFRTPVRKSEVRDYHTKIKRPMDLGTIKYKLNTAKYSTNQEFIKDVLLVFENCFMYNPQESPEYQCGMNLLMFFEQRSRELGLNWKRGEVEKE